MKNYLAIYTCAENSANHQAWKKLDAQTQQERLQLGVKSLGEWMTKYKDQIVNAGGPLGDKTKRINSQGIQDTPSLMGAFLVVKANSQDEAAKMFLEHPHFAIFPGDGVEVLELLEKPRG